MELNVIFVCLFVLYSAIGSFRCVAFAEDVGQGLCNEYYRKLEQEGYGYKFEGLQSLNTTIANEFSKSGQKELVDRFIARFETVSKSLSNFTTNRDMCEGNWKRIGNRTKFYGFGDKPECTVKADKSSIEALKNDEQSLINDINQVKEVGEKISETVLGSYGLTWNGKGFVNDAYKITDKRIVKIRKCDAYRALGIRVNGTWGLAVSIYRDNEWFNAGKYQRIWITEFITSSEEGLSQHKLRYPLCSGEEEESVKFEGYEEGSAAKHREVSLVLWDHFQRSLEHIEKHTGLGPAIKEGDRHRELLQDSSALSNIAILLLPGLLTLFPIGLFQEATLRTVIPYSLATDVISVLPIIIKGSEMINYGRQQYFGNEIRFHGSENIDELAIVQFLPAKCRFEAKQVIIGSVLAIIGLLLMTTGLLLEYFSIKRVQKRKSNDEGSAEGEDHGLLWYWNKEK